VGAQTRGALLHRMLFAYDGSEQVLGPFRLAVAIAKQNFSELHIASVGEVEVVPQTIAHVREQRALAINRLRRLAIYARADLGSGDFEHHSQPLTGDPVRQIIRLAAELKAGLIVIGTKGHSSIYERLIGSRTSRIVSLAPCPVLVARTNNKRRPASIGFRFPFGRDGRRIRSVA